MNRLWMMLVPLLMSFATLNAAPPENTPRGPKSSEAEAHPAPLDADSREALVKFVNARLQEIVAGMTTQPDKSEKLANELMEALDKATTKTASGRQFLAETKGVIGNVQRRIQVARLPLEDVTKALSENPDDATALTNYGVKIQIMVEAIVDEKPDKAVELINSSHKLLVDVQERAKGEATKNAIGRQIKSLSGFDRSIKSAKEVAKLIGTDAKPLDADAWLNGPALTAADLKGKVVLLDFWAVWDGSSLAAFPQLKEWQEKYAANGLVIVGVTNYYGFAWDEENQRPVREGRATPTQERKMLTAFAKQHELTHRIAIDIERGLWEHYAVSGIPHVVLIDRHGKVAMIRVGSSEQKTRSIGEMIEKLVSDK